jgi:hypothetical protein
MNILTVSLLYGSVVSANGSAPLFADRVIRLPEAGVGSVETSFKRENLVLQCLAWLQLSVICPSGRQHR